jgi:MYXO-CTERM domain-containing protein
MRNPATLVLAVAAAVGALSLGPVRARADVIPEDPPCTSPGQPCLTAGPDHNQVGTCVRGKCKPSSGSSGCAVAPTGEGSEDARAAVLLIAAAALTARRRRTSTG